MGFGAKTRISRKQEKPALNEPHTLSTTNESETFCEGVQRNQLPIQKKEVGPYLINQMLGRGGMGCVFLAQHRDISRQVALKVLSPVIATERGAVERFYREARTAAALNHPNVVRIFDVNEVNGTHYLVMEYVRGTTLQALLKDGQKLDVTRCCDIAIAVGQGLYHAHSRGIIHRDIKPSNVMIGLQGEIKILDMGLACFKDEISEGLTAQLGESGILCTPDYAAPEMVESRELVDHRADIYSLGVMLYTLLVGRTPFRGSVTQKIIAHKEEIAPPVGLCNPNVPKTLCELIGSMMAKSPDTRPQTILDVLQRLEPFGSKPDQGTVTLSSTKNKRYTGLKGFWGRLMGKLRGK